MIETASETPIFGMRVTSGVAHRISAYEAHLVYTYPFHAVTGGRGDPFFGVGSGADVAEIAIRGAFCQNHDCPDHFSHDPVLFRRVRVA